VPGYDAAMRVLGTCGRGQQQLAALLRLTGCRLFDLRHRRSLAGHTRWSGAMIGPNRERAFSREDVLPRVYWRQTRILPDQSHAKPCSTTSVAVDKRFCPQLRAPYSH